MPGCGHLFASGRPLSRTRRSNARSQLPQASWLKVRRGAGANFSATERTHKWNGGQVDAEGRQPKFGHDFGRATKVTVPSLDDWEKEWGENSQCSVQPKLLPVDFRSSSAVIAQSN